ncbi:MAG: hypothetical protein Fues2KO_02330 [Fuerstiella sp.]
MDNRCHRFAACGAVRFGVCGLTPAAIRTGRFAAISAMPVIPVQATTCRVQRIQHAILDTQSNGQPT